MEAIPKGAKLTRYLEAAKQEVARPGRNRFVLGNESADLDSMAAAVGWGFYASELSADGDRVFAPLVNVPRADYKLRTEAVFLFSSASIEPRMLTFIDEVDLDALGASGELSILLVDHNVLAESQRALAPSVVGVVDHHKDEGGFTDVVPRIIEPVGSTCTLVAEALLRDTPTALEADLAELLLGTILLDTVNLDEEANRATAKDAEMARRLQAICGADRTTLFERLQLEKFNVASLDTADLLRKDYKQYQMGAVRCGIASVLLSVPDWLSKDPAMAESLAAFATRNQLDLLLAMNAYTDPGFRRELVVWSADPDLRRRVIEFLSASALGLGPLVHPDAPDAPEVMFFTQANAGFSRKKLQPLLQDYLR